jgi:hypothetical protein
MIGDEYYDSDVRTDRLWDVVTADLYGFSVLRAGPRVRVCRMESFYPTSWCENRLWCEDDVLALNTLSLSPNTMNRLKRLAAVLLNPTDDPEQTHVALEAAGVPVSFAECRNCPNPCEDGKLNHSSFLTPV